MKNSHSGELFENAKVGDTVVFHSGGWGDCRELTTITKVGRFINVERRGKDNFRRNGSSVGYRHGRIAPYNEAEWAAYQDSKLDENKRYALNAFDWRNADIELIRQVHALLPVEGK